MAGFGGNDSSGWTRQGGQLLTWSPRIPQRRRRAWQLGQQAPTGWTGNASDCGSAGGDVKRIIHEKGGIRAETRDVIITQRDTELRDQWHMDISLAVYPSLLIHARSVIKKEKIFTFIRKEFRGSSTWFLPSVSPMLTQWWHHNHITHTIKRLADPVLILRMCDKKIH